MPADVTISPGAFPLGAALLAGERAWVLLDTDIDDGTGLGPAIVWARRNGARRARPGRRRGAHGRSSPRHRVLPADRCVGTLDGRDLVAVNPAPLPAPPAADPAHLAFAADIEAAGASVVIEHGVVTGEVRGLEVCRVVDVADGEAVRLEVGVGAHDREAFAIIHGDVPTPQALAGVVAAVAAARSPGSPGHPLNRLAPERLLRWRLEQEPWLVGMESVRPRRATGAPPGSPAPSAVYSRRPPRRRDAGGDRLQRRCRPRRHPVRGRRPPGGGRRCGGRELTGGDARRPSRTRSPAGDQ